MIAPRSGVVLVDFVLPSCHSHTDHGHRVRCGVAFVVVSEPTGGFPRRLVVTSSWSSCPVGRGSRCCPCCAVRCLPHLRPLGAVPRSAKELLTGLCAWRVPCCYGHAARRAESRPRRAICVVNVYDDDVVVVVVAVTLSESPDRRSTWRRSVLAVVFACSGRRFVVVMLPSKAESRARGAPASPPSCSASSSP
jgi:hypothetical protein